uniref:Uncharacterized protein n=1 Tax=Anguilla anguilla TaxID=7936 RepID=A0A0E9VML4_ANGAN
MFSPKIVLLTIANVKL